VLDGLAMLLDAGGLEDLFGGPDDEAAFLYDLLRETARGRASAHYWETCRTARRRSVTPEYVIDRAAVLLASIEERRRADLYRLLGAPPLSSPETLRQRYLELAKTAHPDVGGDAERFRHVKEAYEILRDPERRAEYERFWVRALGPFERVVPDDGVEGVGSVVRARVAVASQSMPTRDEPEKSPDDAPLVAPPSAFEVGRRDVDVAAEDAGEVAPEEGLGVVASEDLAEEVVADDLPTGTGAAGVPAASALADASAAPLEVVAPMDVPGDLLPPAGAASEVAPREAAARPAAVVPAAAPPPALEVPVPPPPAEPRAPERRVVMVGRAMGMRERPQDVVAAATASVLEARASIERRLGPIGGTSGVFALIERVEGALATVSRDDLARSQAEVARSIADLEMVRERLALIADLQQRVAKLVTG